MKINRKKPIPLYLQLKEILLQRIKNGFWKPGEYIYPEHRLAREYGLARATVRNAIKNLIEEGWVYRVPGVGTFVKNKSALKERESISGKLVGVVVPLTGVPVNDSFYFDIMRGIEEELIKNEFEILLGNSRDEPQEENNCIRRFMKKGISGLAIVHEGGNENAKIIRELRGNNFPFVLIDRYLNDIKTNYVGVDNFKGGYIATQYLLELGHRQIAFIGTSIFYTSVMDRLNGYKKALKDFKLKVDKGLICFSSFQREEGGYESMKKILKKRKNLTAVFVINDPMAVGAIRAIKEFKLKVPRDIAVVGFNDQDMARYSQPPLTTIAQPLFEMGRKTAQILIENIREKGIYEQYQHVVLEPKLIVRESSGGKRCLFHRISN